MLADRMLRCSECGVPVLLMTEDQAARRDAHPEQYVFTCLRCSGDAETAARWGEDYSDDGG